MNTTQRALSAFLVMLLISFLTGGPSRAQAPAPEVDRAVRSTLDMLNSSDEEALEQYARQSMGLSTESDIAESMRTLRHIRSKARGLRDDISINLNPDGAIISLSGPEVTRNVKLVLDGDTVTDVELVTADSSGTPMTREAVVRSHTGLMERAHHMNLEDLVEEFREERAAPAYLRNMESDQIESVLKEIQRAAELSGTALFGTDGPDYILTLAGAASKTEIRFQIEDEPPFRITKLKVEGNAPSKQELHFTAENLDSVFQKLVNERDFSGIVFVKKDGRVIHKKPYGVANPDTGAPVKIDTIFGIGSRPIDFTIAGIYLLSKQGRLDLDDSIDQYFEDVPAAKKSITIRHLMEGRSGLPDFHGEPTDWDQDLAWIDRAEAERRILSQELLFEPGSDRRHSHSAFGLLASIIERVSGDSYMTFLDEHFFDPAGMARTGEYGTFNGLDEDEFAVGGGPSFVGEPNIPPNWGKTSWLVKGSGGMYSTLDDLRRFYRYVRTSGVLGDSGVDHFMGSSVHIDGSDRGFELFSATADDTDDEIYMFTNSSGHALFHDIVGGLRQLMQRWQDGE